MKKIILAFTLCAALTAVAQQNEGAAGISFTAPDSTTAAFDKTEHDFGTIKYAGNGECDFTFTNTGSQPMIISRCVGSCGCTVPTWPKEPILPGKTGVIHVKYDTKRVGNFTKSVTITSNAGSGTRILKIKGKVEPQPADPALTPRKTDEHGKTK